MAGIDKTYINNWKDLKEVQDWVRSVGTVFDDWDNEITPVDFMNQWALNMTEEEFYKNQKETHIKQVEYYTRPENVNSLEYLKETYGDDVLDNPNVFFEVCIWNTPTYFDIWLIRNCPVECIQNRLKQQYGCGWSKESLTNHEYDDCSYEAIKNHESIYDKYERNGLGSNIKFTYKDRKTWFVPNSKTYWLIEIFNPNDDDYWTYDEKANWWYSTNAVYAPKGFWTSSACTKYDGKMTDRKIHRILSNWNLPSGLEVRFSGTNVISGHRYCTEDFTVITK